MMKFSAVNKNPTNVIRFGAIHLGKNWNATESEQHQTMTFHWNENKNEKQMRINIVCTVNLLTVNAMQCKTNGDTAVCCSSFICERVDVHYKCSAVSTAWTYLHKIIPKRVHNIHTQWRCVYWAILKMAKNSRVNWILFLSFRHVGRMQGKVICYCFPITTHLFLFSAVSVFVSIAVINGFTTISSLRPETPSTDLFVEDETKRLNVEWRE